MDFFKFIEIVHKHKKALLTIWICCAMAFGGLLVLLPKKYKSSGSFAISGKYFLNPLIKEFLTETSDPSEMRAQKEALILGAISDPFIDSLGFDLGIYSSDLSKTESPALYQERARLRERIEIIPYANSIQISVVDKFPERAKLILERVFETIRVYLKDERKQHLESLRKSVKDQIDKLIADIDYSIDLTNSNSQSGAGLFQAATVNKLKNQLNEKLKFYTLDHPEIKKLQKKIALIEKASSQEMQENSSSSNLALKIGEAQEQTPRKDSVKMEIPLSDSQTLLKGKSSAYENLVVKYEYLNIAINNENSATSSPMAILSRPSYPLSPVSPNKYLLLMWGCLTALILSSLFIALNEAIRLKSKQKSIVLSESKPYLDPDHSLIPGHSQTDRDRPLDH